MSRALLALGGAVFVAVWGWAWTVLPEDGVVHHLGPDGPDAYGSRAGLLVPLALLGMGMVLLLSWLPLVVARRFPEALNHPHKDYWLREENRPVFFRRLQGQMDAMTTATLLLMAVALVETVAATMEWGWPSLMWPALGLYLGFTAWWIVRIVRGSAPPT